jgi:3',5'-cyclic AMP phosphodiesterase CpdA
MRTIVHLSDLHFGRVDLALMPPLVATVHAIRPSLVVVSGDLTQRATAEQFMQARGFLHQLDAPLLVVPGNHDVPLYNLPQRLFNPLGRYRRYITVDLAPVFVDDEIIAVGVNSARAIPFSGIGRINAEQVTRAAARLRDAAPGLVKIVVTHHPFELPEGHDERQLIGRSAMAMTALASAGADVFLSGHLHVSHVAGTAGRYKIAGHSALVVQAGTLSTRQRGEVNAFNTIVIGDAGIDVARHTWEDSQRFAPTWRGSFRRTADGWAPV